jgi:hypothetical protein
VPVGSADQRADDHALVHAGGDAREHLADLYTGHSGVDRLELAADADRGLGFDLPHVLVRGAAAQEDVDDGLVAAGGAKAALGLEAEEVGERQSAGPDAERADAEEAAATEAVAVSGLCAGDGEHGSLRPPVGMAGWGWCGG